MDATLTSQVLRKPPVKIPSNWTAPDTSGQKILKKPDVALDTYVVHNFGDENVDGTKTFSATISGSITGNAGTVTVANEATDTTCFPLFGVSVSGGLEPKTNTALTFNSNTATLSATNQYVTDTLTVSRDTGKGIKVYPASPVFGWKDVLGELTIKTVGVTDPEWVVYRDTIYQYRFTNGAAVREVWLNYHIPHDYVPGTDIYIHTHWSQIAVDTGGAAGVPGVAKWFFDISYADGYGTAGGAADPFVTVKTVSVTQQASTTQYGHMIAEVIISGASDTATTFDRTKFKVDGVLLVRLYHDSTDGDDTLDQSPFVHYVDMHYQTNGVMGTYNKNTPFYS